jgi:hypothetical protein
MIMTKPFKELRSARNAKRADVHEALRDLPGTSDDCFEHRLRAAAGHDINAIVADLKPVADAIRAAELVNIEMANKTVANVVWIANSLGGARLYFKHGQWGNWLRSEFKWSDRTSARYWSVYKLSKVVADLDQLKISVSVLYLLADLNARKRFDFDNPRDALTKIIVLARTEHVTVERAQSIIKPTFVHTYPLRLGTDSEPVDFNMTPKLTPVEEQRQALRTIRLKETAICKLVMHDFLEPYHLQTFKSALAGMMDKQEEKVIAVLVEVLEDYIERKKHPSRFDSIDHVIHDDADFDQPAEALS